MSRRVTKNSIHGWQVHTCIHMHIHADSQVHIHAHALTLQMSSGSLKNRIKKIGCAFAYIVTSRLSSARFWNVLFLNQQWEASRHYPKLGSLPSSFSPLSIHPHMHALTHMYMYIYTYALKKKKDGPDITLASSGWLYICHVVNHFIFLLWEKKLMSKIGPMGTKNCSNPTSVKWSLNQVFGNELVKVWSTPRLVSSLSISWGAPGSAIKSINSRVRHVAQSSQPLCVWLWGTPKSSQAQLPPLWSAMFLPKEIYASNPSPHAQAVAACNNCGKT